MRAVTTYRLWEMKQRREKIAMLTSYDYSMARIVDAAGVDVILVGDSAANVMAGYETTVPITLDMMIYHARSVARAVRRALVVVDLPFGTYQGNSKVALESAVRIMKETEADAVKMEGGEEILESVQRILSAGIPVMGHLGLTPQSIHKFGTYTVRAKEEAEAEAKALAAAQFAQYGMPSAPDEMLAGYAEKILADKEQRYGAPVMRELERICLLKCVDRMWMDHIDNMDQLRQGISLRGYGQKDPVVEYRIEGFDMFDQMVDSIRESSIKMLLTIEVRQAGAAPKREQVAKPTGEGFVPGNGAPGVKGAPKGQPVRVIKIGRNDPCPCGSGLKWKKCTCAQYHPEGSNGGEN